VHRSRHGYTDDDLAHIARLSPDDLSNLLPRNFAPRLRIVRDDRPTPTVGPQGTTRRSA
jgi:hypothetical protein